MIKKAARALCTASSALVGSLPCLLTYAATLPVPCAGGACGPNVSTFVTAGRASAVQAGSTFTVNQTSANATLNWQSFDISADGTVRFVQPSASSVTLNRIFQANPSQIFGALQANGRVFLINRNGIIFGPGAQVNVGSLLASTLNLTEAAVNGGLVAPGLNQQAALQQFTDANGLALSSAPITIQNGATLKTDEGGQVLVFAPVITNEGSISTPGGQTLLAAGNQIYLSSSTDANLRGLLVEVGGAGGTVTNGNAANATASAASSLVGQISAERGNVTLAGLAVNQLGRISASTSVNENGSIRLQARDQGAISGSAILLPRNGGSLQLGARSDTEVNLASGDPAKTVDSVAQPKSDINLIGNTIEILNDSVVRATSGTIEALAKTNQGSVAFTNIADASRVNVAKGAILDVSGANITRPVDENIIAVQLRGTEFADSPLQRTSPLRSQTVYVDVRAHGTRADGTPWQGTPLADVSGEVAAISRDVSERNLSGGSISLNSQGDVILAAGSQLSVAGGSVQYTGGTVKTSTLITADGLAVSINAADPNVAYAGILDGSSTVNPKWGYVQNTPAVVTPYAPGYVEGKDAGSVSLATPRFVFDASVNGGVAIGANQRLPAGSVRLPTSPLYRSYDEVPLGALLTVGITGPISSDFVTGDVVFKSGAVLQNLRNADGSSFDSLHAAALPQDYTASVLSPSLFGASGFNRAALNSNGMISLAGNANLRFGVGGSFSATAGRIALQGSIDAPGGTIAALAEPTATTTDQVKLSVGPGSLLTVEGGWVNDALALAVGEDFAPLFLNGGSVSLAAVSGGLNVAAGSLIDVSGGAQLTASGSIVAGVGGAIKLSAATPSSSVAPTKPVEMSFAASLRGYGLLKGGTLSLSARGICVATSDCSRGDPSMLWLAPDQFRRGGFENYQVSAQGGGLVLEAGTAVNLTQQNWQLSSDLTSVGSARSLNGVATIASLPDYIRRPVNLGLSLAVPPTEITGSQSTLSVTSDTASLLIAGGASIAGETGASIALNANSRLIVDGAVRAPGGNISLTLNAGILENVYAPSQAIWLGSHGVLDAAGSAQIQVADTGLRSGTVLAGGNVSLNAMRGSVELLPGSLIDISGTAATVDVIPYGGSGGIAQQIASAGGTLKISAAENISLDGSLRAQAGQPDSAAVARSLGGSLSAALQPFNRGDNAVINPGFGFISSFPDAPRRIEVSATVPPVVVGEGTDVPLSIAGRAFIGADTLNAAGFDSVALQAAPVTTANGVLTGSIRFSGDVTVSTGRQVTLDAAAYSVDAGATAKIRAPYVLFGNSDQNNYPMALEGSGTGRLKVSGNFIELYGTSALQGIGTASFSSTGDLRVRGLQNLSVNAPSTLISGGLYAAGDVELTAQQIYPTTLSQFAIASDAQSGTIRVNRAPGKAGDVLSAASSLSLSAQQILQDGTLRAPFGNITLRGDLVTLGAGSLTATSADGLTIPFGTIQGGFDWVYPLQQFLSTVYGKNGVAPPAQRVTLQGKNVNVGSGAVVDVSGGGDLLAYEWVPGVGGTRDVLSPLERANQFAIVPSLNLATAPYDPAASLNTALQVGDEVHLSGSPELPGGDYVLMPARYALLPGAFLVTPVNGFQDLQPGQAIAAASGGHVVAGYRGVAGTAFGTSRYSGFQVVPRSVVQQLAQYTTAGANDFFKQQALHDAASIPRIPKDCGILALSASAELSLQGSLRTTPATGGRGAGVDIASANILVAPNDSTAAAPGQIVLSADSLDQLGVQSLLLGGQRNGNAVTTQAQTVTIAAGTTLSAPELILTAQDKVKVDSGASLTAKGAAAPAASYTLQGDGAFLRVATGSQATVARMGASSAAGVLNLDTGSTVSAAKGSLYLEASSNVLANASLYLGGADLALQSTRISLGNAPATTMGTVLGNNILSISGLRNLLLSSQSSIDFYRGADFSAQSLTLDATGLSGFGANGDAAKIAVNGTLILENSRSAAAANAGSGSGTLTLGASKIEVGPGALALSGFSDAALSADQSLTGVANGSMSTNGNLDVSASRIATKSGVGYALTATGAVTASAPTSVASLSAETDLGGSVDFTGARVDVNTHFELPSGRVRLTSTGHDPGDDVIVGPNAVINVAGLTRIYDGVPVGSPGGSVLLKSAQDVVASSGSLIDVSAGADGQGGAMSVQASAGNASLSGTFKGGGRGATGSSFKIDAQTFGDFTSLNQELNSGGFSAARSVRLRGSGDLTVGTGADNAVHAHNVLLQADQGAIRVAGLIDASGGDGGSVRLAAAGDIRLTGQIDAHGTAPASKGGRVELETTAGSLALAAGAGIDVGGNAQGGSVLMRAPRAAVADVANGGAGVSLPGSITGSSRTMLEAFSVYQNSLGEISALDTSVDPSNPLYADAAAFTGNAAAITAALGHGGDPNFVLAPGIEIRSAGDLALNTPWNLYDWRFNGVPGVLTVRAGGALTINSQLSDGFTSPTTFVLPRTPTISWSYRLVSGSDLAAADPLSVSGSATAPFNVTAGTAGGGRGSGPSPHMVRTGDGFVDITSAGDLTLGNQQSLIYTAGVSRPGIQLIGAGRAGAGLAYPRGGGSIRIDAQGSILGSVPDQFVTEWLWRSGDLPTNPTAPAVAWTVNFGSFQQGVGALGGGDVSIRAGGDIRDFSASIPSIGVQVGGKTMANSIVQVTGGGNLDVEAGGSILSGGFYVGRGALNLNAGDDIGIVTSNDGNVRTSSLIGLGDGSVTATARRNLQVSGIVNPTLINGGATQGGANFYSTYGLQSRAQLTAVGGDLLLDNESGALGQQLQNSLIGAVIGRDLDPSNVPVALDILPPTFDAYALGGDIRLGRSFGTLPAANGGLRLFAEQNIISAPASGFAVQIVVSDADIGNLPTASSPQQNLQPLSDVMSGLTKSLADQYAAVPVHLDDANPEPVRMVARTGDIVFPAVAGGSQSGLWSALPARIIAGRDILNLDLIAQNLRNADVTALVAGRDIAYPLARSPIGAVLPNVSEITVDGPGELQLQAGRNVNLGTSNGITTRGNLINTGLTNGGADVSVAAGVGAKGAQFDGFVAKYVTGGTLFDVDLVEFIGAKTGAKPGSAAEAKQIFNGLSFELRRSFVEAEFFALIRDVGRKAARSGSRDFRDAFAAIVTLFPGANPDLAKGETNPYVGDIALYFSRAYTLKGGSISMLAPGGQINVGLAAPPASFGISKTPSQLGLVAQSAGDINAFEYADFQVNQSRVFAADGGNILDWSTEGDIDAGRGSKTAISAPPPTITIDNNGRPIVTFPNALAGSGIQTLATSRGVMPGNVDLFAPRGVVNANDAGIVAGNLTIAATAVLGASNITVSGTSVGVPVAVTGLGANVAGASSSAGSTTNAAESTAGAREQRSNTPVADAALGFLDVFVTGLGEENCKQDDMECLKRQKRPH